VSWQPLSRKVWEQMQEAYKDAYEEDSPVWEALKTFSEMAIAAEIADIQAAERWDPVKAWDPWSENEFIDGPTFDRLIEEIEAKDRVAGEYKVKLRGASPLAKQRYGDVALKNACERVRSTPPGARSNELVREAFGIGKLLPGGYLSEQTVAEALLSAAQESGLHRSQAVGTIRRGIERGKLNPRQESKAAPAQTRAEFDWSDLGRFRG
jgi:hypothetical protein